MLQAIFKEISEAISVLLEHQFKKLTHKAWKIFIGLNIARLSFYLILFGFGFLGISFYQWLSHCLGPIATPALTGVLFFLLAFLMLLIAKRMIKGCNHKCKPND